MSLEYKDYYKTLGVDKAATQDAIQKAYRKLARTYHPDLNKEQGAEDKFKEVNEAYEVLGDKEKRKLYDELGNNWQAGGAYRGQQEADEFIRGWREQRHASSGSQHYSGFGSAGEAFGSGGYSDFFSFLFGNQGPFFEQSSTGFQSSRETRQPALEADIDVSFEDSFHGAEKEYQFEFLSVGQDGTRNKERRTFRVKIPLGAKEGTKIRLKGQGGAGRDLILRVHLVQHPIYSFDGDKLVADLKVSPSEAALGSKIHLQTPAGEVLLNLASGSQSGAMLRLKSKGMHNRDGRRGDLYVRIQICVPTQLTEVERELYKQLAEKSSFTPRNTKGY